MTKNPERRLGYDNEELNIKRHQFFAPIDWAKLERREIKPEFVPDGSKLNFEKDFTEEEPTLRIVFKKIFRVRFLIDVGTVRATNVRALFTTNSRKHMYGRV